MNQYRFIKMLFSKRDWISNTDKDKLENLRSYALSIYSTKGTLEEIGPIIMGLEGSASRLYFGMLNMMMPNSFKFHGRSSRPAQDAFNAFLNYAYGILYSRTERALVIAGLDPYIGLLHSDNYNKKSFVFDFIEPYRTLVDEPVYYLFTRNKCKAEYLQSIYKGVTLSTEGKKFFAPYILESLEQIIRYRNKNRKKIDMIQTDAHSFANFLIGKNDNYLEASVARRFENFIESIQLFDDEEEPC
jgi:CRISPR-associated protein Cas1